MNENFINTWVSNVELERTPNKRAYMAKRRQHGLKPFDKTHPLGQAIMKGWKEYSPSDSLVISPKLELMGRQPVNDLLSSGNLAQRYLTFLKGSLAGKLPGFGEDTSASQSVDWESLLESGHGVTDALKVVLTHKDPEQEILSTFRAAGRGYIDYTFVEIDATAFENGGLLTIDIWVGDGESSGAFDLFDSKLPTEGEPRGALASKHGVPPGQRRGIAYTFDRGQVFKLGATGDWSSEKGSINGFLAKISIKPNQKPEPKVELNQKPEPKNVSPILSYLSPEDVMNAFVKALKNVDLEAIRSMMTGRALEESGGIAAVDVPEDMRTIARQMLSHLEVLSSEYVGDEFHFRLRVPMAEPPELTHKMRKVEGIWLIYDVEPVNED